MVNMGILCSGPGTDGPGSDVIPIESAYRRDVEFDLEIVARLRQ